MAIRTDPPGEMLASLDASEDWGCSAARPEASDLG